MTATTDSEQPTGAHSGEPAFRQLRVEGVVQGVGYRPFVYTLAVRLRLTGWVLNDSQGVLTEVCGPREVLDDFTRALRDEAPPLAKVTAVRVVEPSAPPQEHTAFRILESRRGAAASTYVAPDSHVCADCLREVRDPADRRHDYPFTNCTNCGPRYSIITSLPYDRPNTTMADFAMCADCAAEYADPLDRRYHAQPNACPACGPQLALHDTTGAVVGTGPAALTATAAALAAGKIVAVKSVGGFHLAVNARDAAAVALLRERKRRDSKPFAVMTGDLAAVGRIARVSGAEAGLLESPPRPIVLLRKVPGALPEIVAPRNPNVGVMLPSAALHHLLLDHSGLDVLVMTSGNVSGLPIAHRNADALRHLTTIADLVLVNDRDIQVRVDDSVVRLTEHPRLPEPLVTFFRRGRGYAPYPVRIDEVPQPVVAYGAELKTTVAVASGTDAYLSQHIGDLKNDEVFAAHQDAVRHLCALYGLDPALAACDMHPSFRSHLAARAADGVLDPVQHHHAHMASCMAENQLTGPVLGVLLDGAGYGPDGTIWGAELFLGDFTGFRRVAHLRPIPLPGGDQAVREPVRTAWVLALDAFGGDDTAAAAAFPALAALDPQRRHVYTTMVRRGINSPPVSSTGRFFDGVAALLGVCALAEYEAQGPIELEGLLERDLTMAPPYPFALGTPAPGVTEFDPRPLVRAMAGDLAAGADPAWISRRVHSGVVALVRDLCVAESERAGVDEVVLSGGVFLNEFLAVNTLLALRSAGLRAHCHRLVPPNDGGISLGQVAVAAARARRAQPPVKEEGRDD
ncbi:carbamoyltransferase HypF [Lentzea sp. NPDC060358]|uniref:carbamoyltransferase HypF n=1 Tax=Lentzea sp. NPDC060358 TaxID=3347103 RepID=UPI00365F803B